MADNDQEELATEPDPIVVPRPEVLDEEDVEAPEEEEDAQP
jgi:hypothetical protein